MLNDNALKEIADLFCGTDDGKWFMYKSGPKLVNFFNNNFQFDDVYGNGFPSRWFYVKEKLSIMCSDNRIDDFFNIILSKQYQIFERQVSEVEALIHVSEVHKEISRILKKFSFSLVKNGEKYFLVQDDDDLDYVASGGFAEVYLQKSTGYIVKKLKSEYVIVDAISKRFKQEFLIMKEQLSDVDSVLDVIDFNEGDYSYRMVQADSTLEHYINRSVLTEAEKISLVEEIISDVSDIHNREIIHRDISPTNIFLVNKKIKIADFSLGKFLNDDNLHSTNSTKSFGQFSYCAPEQYKSLKQGDKRSDVYSLGKVVNFIMTSDCDNSQHSLRSVVEKALTDNPSSRYVDASELLTYVQKSIQYSNDDSRREKFFLEIKNSKFTEDVKSYIYDMNSETICMYLMQREKGFENAILRFMQLNDSDSLEIIRGINENYDKVTEGIFERYDPFAKFAYQVLQEKFSFPVKEISAKLLNEIAVSVNRFYAQDLVEEIIKNGVEPLIEEILNRDWKTIAEDKMKKI